MKADHLADDGYFIFHCILVPVRGRPTSDGKALVSWTSESGTLFLEDEGLTFPEVSCRGHCGGPLL
jgi:hypothetical protein